MVKGCITEEFRKFRNLSFGIQEVLFEKIKERMIQTKKQISDLIESENALINSRNPYFAEVKNKAFAKLAANSNSGPEQASVEIKEGGSGAVVPAFTEEEKKCQLVEDLTKGYFNMIRLKIEDSVPKAIMFYLVNHLKDSLHGFLVEELYKDDDVQTLLAEDNKIAANRREWQQRLDAYEEASKKLMKV